jgi:hypothetical protein
MATIIRAHDGQEFSVSPKNKEIGFTLQELYDLIGNNCDCVEHITLADGRSMWLDEEGKFRKPLLHENAKATRLLHKAGGMPEDYVVGNVLIEKGEVQ